MEFIETSIFSQQLRGLLNDDQFRILQSALGLRPDMGAVISGSGGIRKARWPAPGRGKRGGLRVIYFWYHAEHLIYLLMIYAKNEQDDLTPEQLRLLKKVIAEEHP